MLSGETDEFIEAVKSLTKGRRGKRWLRERSCLPACLLRNAESGRLNDEPVRSAKLPIGSGTMESRVRRVVNLRLKGTSIYWDESQAEAMLLLRSYDKAKHWKVLNLKAFTPNATLGL